MRNNWYKLLFGVCAVVILVSTAAAELWSTNKDQDLGRNMEIMLNVMREVSTNYVDEVASDKLLQDGANGMLSKLDPYTAFIPETELEEFEILSTGKYGGIGAAIAAGISIITKAISKNRQALEYSKYAALMDTPADSAYAVMWYGE